MNCLKSIYWGTFSYLFCHPNEFLIESSLKANAFTAGGQFTFPSLAPRCILLAKPGFPPTGLG